MGYVFQCHKNYFDATDTPTHIIQQWIIQII